ncbi:hypothetical protein [Cryptosporangium japonicum]|uniref:Uncharacterized protein n=1 Tax=Cryptosporangium japonicum TaxID=80872 RepID=A0ABN0U642_9ACTN
MKPTHDLVLATAFGARTLGGLPIFLERMWHPHATDTVDPGQAVELRWRQLSGLDSPELAAALRVEIPPIQESVKRSALPGAAVASASLDVCLYFLGDTVSSAEAAGLALAVAGEMDRTGAAPPAGGDSWAAHEARGQADVVDSLPRTDGALSAEDVSDIRSAAGADSLTYRYAVAALLGPPPPFEFARRT